MRLTFKSFHLALVLFPLLQGCHSTMIFSSSENDASILINGRVVGTGESPVIKIPNNRCYTIEVEKTGFFTEKFIQCYEGFWFGSPKSRFIELRHDDAYDASTTTDYANKDFEVETNHKLSEADAWKLISQIVTSYFDNLELADKSTGYLKTGWQTKSFQKMTIRTRIIVKQSSSLPLKYKIKIISEYAESPNQSVKDDDKFKSWDRVLRAYDGIITEFQSRLGGK